MLPYLLPQETQNKVNSSLTVVTCHSHKLSSPVSPISLAHVSKLWLYMGNR